MIKIKMFSLLILLVVASKLQAQSAPIPAFPGAEGFGASTPGGRGGKILMVTNLNDSGPGSFREACETKGPRIVIFRVSGVIDLKTPLNIYEPYITIAGQTAPGEGICLKRNEFKVYTHDAIIRFIRSRPGDISGKAMDAMGVGNGGHDDILDHCSANWSVDECLSPSGNIYNVTVQWCIIGESLNKSVHPKGEHGFGSLVRAIGGVTLHHNLWIDNVARNPRLGDNYGRKPWPTFDVRNNVMYNWGGICSGLTGDSLSTNYIANYLLPGPNSSNRAPIVLSKTAGVKYYVKDNMVVGETKYDKNPASLFTPSEANNNKLYTLSDKPFDAPTVKTTSAKEAYLQVLALVGAICPVRDSIDSRLIREARTNTGRIINSQNEVGGWPVYQSAVPAKDSDNDGIPDAWEIDHGLDPNNALDASLPSKAGNGYSNIEIYINTMAQDIINQNTGN